MHHTEVIGIASGKGGAGKTTVAVNLALALQKSGYRVMLFDADLGLANAPILLGCHCPFNVSHFLRSEKSLAEIAVTTSQGLRLIPGASGNQQLAALNAVDALKIVQAFSDFDEAVDYLIVDMAASHRRLIVARNAPSSIADAYGNIKVLADDYGLDEIYLVPNAMKSQQEMSGTVQFFNDRQMRPVRATVLH